MSFIFYPYTKWHLSSRQLFKYLDLALVFFSLGSVTLEAVHFPKKNSAESKGFVERETSFKLFVLVSQTRRVTRVTLRHNATRPHFASIFGPVPSSLHLRVSFSPAKQYWYRFHPMGRLSKRQKLARTAREAAGARFVLDEDKSSNSSDDDTSIPPSVTVPSTSKPKTLKAQILEKDDRITELETAISDLQTAPSSHRPPPASA
ncbi:hypothetical protein B0H11DRAFT_1936522 [Mycena galericulata]|nr:hypothetical protein B0H11DRAFT_1936521 [Mycena galericulata]KAJ7436678.1 hypothetical protein B0H11DRAFT_1936522 [Mycena galericulata]